jgi:biopolymer transport protein ExbD
MATTTYSKFSELKITLPDAEAEAQSKRPKEVTVSIDSSGRIAVDKQVLNVANVNAVADALRTASKGGTETVVIINADAQAAHQSVINVMEAARVAQLTQITFATQSQKSK